MTLSVLQLSAAASAESFLAGVCLDFPAGRMVTSSLLTHRYIPTNH